MTLPPIDFEKESAARKAQYEHEEELRIHEAAEQGNVKEQYGLGIIYHSRQDYSKALRWWCKAAEQGYTEALISIGSMYKEGRGVVQDYVQAHICFYIASALGDQPIKKIWEAFKKKMTDQQIAEAEREANKWLEAYKKRRP